MRTDRTHYTVPELVAFDIATNPPPPGMVVNCISCWGVSRQGVPDAHTIAWYPLAKVPASARQRAQQMVKAPEPAADEHKAIYCTCHVNERGWGEHHAEHCEFYGIPF